ncbi:odorant receptor 2a-like [Diachasmimorpha longicaudata]|uniref:odorant receptor 2a-like n=1 Tax=Diachasmimorpha longicaudata TaxID=58733 RepID=UPI0030B8D139
MRQRSVTHTETMTEPLEEISRESDIRYAYGLYEIIYQIMGLWPATCQTVGAWFLTIFVCIAQITMIFFVIGEAVISTSQLDLQLLSYVSCNFLSFVKIIVIRANWCNMHSVIDDLTSAWKTISEPQVLKIMKARAKLGRKICIYQMSTTYFVCLPSIIMTLPPFLPAVNDTMNSTVSVVRSYPLQTSQMFAGLSTGPYVIMFVYQIIQIYLTSTANMGNDVCFFGIAINLTAQFECLSVTCEGIDERRNASRESGFSAVIRRQIELIDLAKKLEGTFNVIILCIISTNCIQICLYGILLIRSARIGDFVVVINAAICVIVLGFQIFLYCYAGDSLSRAIENVGTTAYNCLWYEMSPKSKTVVLFILLRTSRIFSLTAGKMYRMDLDSFKNIVKAIGSYFSVMQAMFEE